MIRTRLPARAVPQLAAGTGPIGYGLGPWASCSLWRRRKARRPARGCYQRRLPNLRSRTSGSSSSAAATLIPVRCGRTARPCVGAPVRPVRRLNAVRPISARPRHQMVSGSRPTAVAASTRAACVTTVPPRAGGPASTTRPRTWARLASARQSRRMVKSSPPPAAGGHTCGLREDRSVGCWGPEPRPGPFGGWEAPPEAHFASIDGAYGYTCGLPLEGTPICWGSDSESPNLARCPPSDQWFTAISGGGGHACGLQTDGSAVCWGILADGPPPGQRFASMSSGVGHTCGLRADDGTVA